MDSFYDAPRHAPVPTRVEKFLPSSVVPEVSLISSSKTPTNKYLLYNSWKIPQTTSDNPVILNREHLTVTTPTFGETQYPDSQNSSQLFKKQVRFESPVLQQRPSLTYEPYNTKKILTQNCTNTPDVIKEPFKSCDKAFKQNLPSNIINFEKKYLSNVPDNIPNRTLDLSLIDVANKQNKNKKCTENKDQIELVDSHVPDVEENVCENKENVLPKTYREFLYTQNKTTNQRKENPNDSVTDIFNYKRREFDSKNTSSDNKSTRVFIPRYSAGGINLIDRNIPFDTCNRDYLKVNSDGDTRLCTWQKQTHSPFFENDHYNPKNFNPVSKCDRITQTSMAYNQPEPQPTQVSKNDAEPSNRDLLKIIAQQNEQLLILQKQVAMLLNKEQNQPKQIEAPQPNCSEAEKCVVTTQNEVPNRNPSQEGSNTPKKHGVSKFSIGLMTSFEVAIRPQHNKQNFVNHEPKIQEITESESGMPENASAVDKICEKTMVDTSLHLQEPVKVREMCPSPEPSININMNDYDSSDDEEMSVSEIGATFYRNLMGQVNDILRKAQVQTKDELRDVGTQKCVDKLKGQTMNRVKEATLKHLKNIGVTIGPIEKSEEVESPVCDGKDYNPTEISFAVKQLLLKYLPDEQLAKISYKCPPSNKNPKSGIISARPDFSFASLEYMKKYNLISNKDAKPRDTGQCPKVANAPQKPEGPKILDITALKMQPKLL